MRLIATLLFLLFHGNSQVALGQNATLRGFVFDLETGDPVPFAEVVAAHGGKTVTDVNGFFQLDHLPSGLVSFRLAAIGYENCEFRCPLSQGSLISEHVYLQPVEHIPSPIPRDDCGPLTAVAMRKMEPIPPPVLPGPDPAEPVHYLECCYGWNPADLNNSKYGDSDGFRLNSWNDDFGIYWH